MNDALAERLAAIVGARHLSTDHDVLAGRCIDYTGRYRGRAAALVRPGSDDEVAAAVGCAPAWRGGVGPFATSPVL